MSRLIVTLAVDNAAPGKAIGIKEALAMDVEAKYGDVTVLRVEVVAEEQLSFLPRSKQRKEDENVREDRTT